MNTSISDILKNSLKSENFKMNSNLLIHLKEKNTSFYKIASVIEKNIFAKKIKKEDVLEQSYFDKKLTLLQNIKLQSHIIHSDHQFFLNYLHTETNFDEYKNSLFKDIELELWNRYEILFFIYANSCLLVNADKFFGPQGLSLNEMNNLTKDKQIFFLTNKKNLHQFIKFFDVFMLIENNTYKYFKEPKIFLNKIKE